MREDEKYYVQIPTYLFQLSLSCVMLPTEINENNPKFPSSVENIQTQKITMQDIFRGAIVAFATLSFS
jgi:hypothetical protein